VNYSVDTNIFLRFLIKDVPEKAERVRKFFEKAKEGKHQLIVEPFVIVETAHMLSRYFKLPKYEVCTKLRSILSIPFLDVLDRKDLSEVVDLYEKRGIDFIDALLFVRTIKKDAIKILSFDKDFAKLTPNLYVEP
jgi:predicted nucleic-acid-binding protein